MMGKGQDHCGGRRGAMGPNVMGSMLIRMMFAQMDADGDGKLSLQEFQAAHERIFKATDANKDGFVTLQEMQNSIRGTSTRSNRVTTAPHCVCGLFPLIASPKASI
jgi:hypothetical protein